jgi:hypothetical protein
VNSDRRPPPPRRGPPRRGPAPSGRRPPPRQGQRQGPPPGRGRPPGRRPSGPRPAPKKRKQEAGFDLDDVAPDDNAAFANRPRAASFEIRKGKRRSEDEPEDDDNIPIQAIALPQSITSEEEGNELKDRLGVESLPDLDRRHNSVQVTQSRGASGPDRRRIGLKVFLVLLILAGIGAAVAWQMGMLEGVLPK